MKKKLPCKCIKTDNAQANEVNMHYKMKVAMSEKIDHVKKK